MARPRVGHCVARCGRFVVVGNGTLTFAGPEILDLETRLWSDLPPPFVTDHLPSYSLVARDDSSLIALRLEAAAALDFSKQKPSWSPLPRLQFPQRLDHVAYIVAQI